MTRPLHFTIAISAPVARVWDAMLRPETYKVWTTAFTSGSYYEGSWEQGATIRFFDAKRDGMVAEIAEYRRHEYISIRLLGEVHAGTDDTTSDSVRAWAPAYENYTFRSTAQGTELRVSVDVTAEYEQMMLDKYPKALGLLKALCEQAAPAGGA